MKIVKNEGDEEIKTINSKYYKDENNENTDDKTFNPNCLRKS